MPKPIRGDKGRFAGSIGEGKGNIPTPANLPGVPQPETTHDALPSMSRLHQYHIRQLAVSTDTEIASLTREVFVHESRMSVAVNSLHHSLGHRQERVAGRGFGREYLQSVPETLAEVTSVLEDEEAPEWRKAPLRRTLDDYEAARGAREQHMSRIRELDAVYRRHYWTRAFLVQGGHVHSSMECSTCNRGGNDTDFVWLPEYSGSDETLIVEDAGERACTVCYPSAPVSVLQRPTRIFSEDERRQIEEAENRRAQREASRAAKAAKAPTVSGEPLVLETGESATWRGETQMRKVELKTERTAVSFAVDIVAAQRSGNSWMAPYEVQPSHYDVVRDAIADAIAQKRGCTVEEVMEEISKKADAKVRRASR